MCIAMVCMYVLCLVWLSRQLAVHLLGMSLFCVLWSVTWHKETHVSTSSQPLCCETKDAQEAWSLHLSSTY